MANITQYFSKPVSSDDVHMFLMDRDLEDVIQVLCKDDTCYVFDSKDLDSARLHDILDMLCDFVI
jgi:hypothetical protein